MTQLLNLAKPEPIKILVSELKVLRKNPFFLILRAFISETKKIFALWARI
jgi:hypothetical protein